MRIFTARYRLALGIAGSLFVLGGVHGETIPQPESFAAPAHEAAFKKHAEAVTASEAEAKSKTGELRTRYLKALAALAKKGDSSAKGEMTRIQENKPISRIDLVVASDGVKKLMGIKEAEEKKIDEAQKERNRAALASYADALKAVLKDLEANGLESASAVSKELEEQIEPRLAQTAKAKADKTGEVAGESPAPPPPGMGVPADAVAYGGHHYKIFEGKLGFEEARKACEKLGGHLATLETAEEHAFATKMRDLSRGQGLWIGASTGKEGGGKWMWVTGTPVDRSSQMFQKQRALTTSEDIPEKSDGKDFMMLYRSRTTGNFHWLSHFMESGGQRVIGYICEWDR